VCISAKFLVLCGHLDIFLCTPIIFVGRIVIITLLSLCLLVRNIFPLAVLVISKKSRRLLRLRISCYLICLFISLSRYATSREVAGSSPDEVIKSGKRGSLDVSQPHRPPRSVTGISLLYFILLYFLICLFTSMYLLVSVRILGVS
jgi:hypothetical protein